jgi:hypothetical protein
MHSNAERASPGGLTRHVDVPGKDVDTEPSDKGPSNDQHSASGRH